MISRLVRGAERCEKRFYVMKRAVARTPPTISLRQRISGKRTICAIQCCRKNRLLPYVKRGILVHLLEKVVKVVRGRLGRPLPELLCPISHAAQNVKRVDVTRLGRRIVAHHLQ